MYMRMRVYATGIYLGMCMYACTSFGGMRRSLELPEKNTQEQLDLVRKVASGKSVCCFRHVYMLVYVCMRACMYVRLCM